jgi:NADH-quinone oxidoreductase subunit J
MEATLFYVLSGAAIAGGAGVVLNLRNAVSAAMCLVLSMLALAGLFVLLHAEFIGLIQVLVYAGAIVVLFLFVIMLLNLKADTMGAENQPVLKIVGTLVAGAVTVKLVSMVTLLRTPWPEVEPSFGTTREMGRILYTDYVLPFEITGILLLAAIVGAVTLAKKRLDG